MAFWRTWNWDTSSIDKILDGDNPTIEQLLNDDEILSEMKGQNKKLIDFLIIPANLNRVLSYVTDEHTELGQDKQYRYSYISFEILCSDSYTLCETIFQSSVLDGLLNFWYKSAPLNHHLAGYVYRIINFLLTKRKSEVIQLMKQKEQFLEKLISHIYNAAAVELLIKIVACDDTETVTADWLASNGFIRTLVEKLSPNSDEITNENVGQILANIVVISLQSHSMGGDDVLLQQLEDENVLRSLVKNIFADSQSTALLHGSIILVELIRKNSSDSYEPSLDTKSLPLILQILLENLEQINSYLKNSPQNSLATSSGSIVPLGMHRMKLIELFGMLISTRYCAIFNKILETDLFDTCFTLFFDLPCNNFLHTIVARAFQIILDCRQTELVVKLLQNSRVPTLFAKAGIAASKLDQNSNKRPGYMGFISSLTGQLIRIAEEIPIVNEILLECDLWEDYVQGDFAQMVYLESKPLGGTSHCSDSESESLNGGEPLVTNFQTLVKRAFENEFPDDFAVGNLDDPEIDSLLHPPSGAMFFGVAPPLQYGNEFDYD